MVDGQGRRLTPASLQLSVVAAGDVTAGRRKNVHVITPGAEPPRSQGPVYHCWPRARNAPRGWPTDMVCGVCIAVGYGRELLAVPRDESCDMHGTVISIN